MKFPEVLPAVLGTVITRAAWLALAQADFRRCDRVAARAHGGTRDRGANRSPLKTRKQPVLLTLRIVAEGGKRPGPRERRALSLRLLPHVDAIDIELATMKAIATGDRRGEAHRQNVVLSDHASSKPATPAQVARWLGNRSATAHHNLKSLGASRTGATCRARRAPVNYPGQPDRRQGIGATVAVALSWPHSVRGSFTVTSTARRAGQPSAQTCAKWRGLELVKDAGFLGQLLFVVREHAVLAFAREPSRQRRMLSASDGGPTRGETRWQKEAAERPEMSANITMKMKLCSDDGSPFTLGKSRG